MPSQDFTEKETLKTNFKSQGKSGTLVTSDTVENDYLPNLIGQEAQELFFKMLLSDSQIRKLYHAVCNPIKSASWDIQPASDEPQDLEVAALIKQILFCDLPDGWTAKLDEILTFPWHGHAIFEVIHQNRQHKTLGPYTGLANLAFRDQRTIDKWIFTPEGILETLHQLQAGDIEVDNDIAADTCLIFYNEKKGNDTGYPFCRMLYGNYKRKLLYKQLQAIGIEKGAIGVPVLNLPAGIDYESAEYAEAVAQLTLYTQAENAFIILPNEYELKLDQANTFDPARVQAAIKAENEEISGSLVAMWLEMGIGGNSAVGSSTGISADFFRDGIEYLANKISDPINLHLIPNLVALNFGDTIEVMPTLVHSGIADEAGKELMEVVTGYTKNNVIIPDEALEDFIRQQHNLPKKVEGEMLENGKAQDEDANDSPDDNTDDPSDDDGGEELELSSKGEPKTPRALIVSQATKVSDNIRESLDAAQAKYINDVMNRYKQLGANRKQNATTKVKIGFNNNLKKDLKRSLTETVVKAIDMARAEVPAASAVELSSKESDVKRVVEKYSIDLADSKINDLSKLPTHIQVLIAKQADLISTDSLADMKKRIDFAFSSIETKSSDENVIKQAMQEDADKFVQSSTVDTKGTNAASLMVNEGRDTFFFDDDVHDLIHSFTFVNHSPKSDICRELAGTTFNTNDAESLRYSPPLHHNCKSYLRANLKEHKGVGNLDISTLSPSAKAKKSITL